MKFIHIYIFCTTSSPFTNFSLLYPKTAPCPEAAAQTTTIAAANQAAAHCKAFPKPLRARFLISYNFNEVQIKFE
jgi:hypothetical protein